MITLTPDQAALVAFPPGCPVLHSSFSPTDSIITPCAQIGIVESVSIDVSPAPTAPRELMYRVKFPGMTETKIVPESELKFAPQCPVVIAVPDASKPSETQKPWASSIEGKVLATLDVPNAGVGTRTEATVETTYSVVMVHLPGGKSAIEHGVTSDRITFRAPPPAPAAAAAAVHSVQNRPPAPALSAPHFQRNPPVPIQIPPRKESAAGIARPVSLQGNIGTKGGDATPGEEQMRTETMKRTNIMSNELTAKRQRRTPPSCQEASATDDDNSSSPLTCTYTFDLDEHTSESRGAQKIRIPQWLNESTRANGYSLIGFLVGKGGKKKKSLEQKHQCSLHIRGDGSGSRIDSEDDLHICVESPGGEYNIAYYQMVGRLKRDVEEILVEFIADDDSLGRLLYDYASHNFQARTKRQRSFAGKAVYQRAYHNLEQMVWMQVVELPVDGSGECHGRFLGKPGEGCLKETRRDSHCRVDIFGAWDEEILCNPYLIVTSKDFANVSAGTRQLESKILEHQSKCRKKCKR